VELHLEIDNLHLHTVFDEYVCDVLQDLCLERLPLMHIALLYGLWGLTDLVGNSRSDPIALALSCAYCLSCFSDINCDTHTHIQTINTDTDPCIHAL